MNIGLIKDEISALKDRISIYKNAMYEILARAVPTRLIDESGKIITQYPNETLELLYSCDKVIKEDLNKLQELEEKQKIWYIAQQ